MSSCESPLKCPRLRIHTPDISLSNCMTVIMYPRLRIHKPDISLSTCMTVAMYPRPRIHKPDISLSNYKSLRMCPEIPAMHFKYVTLLSVDVVCIGLIFFLNNIFFLSWRFDSPLGGAHARLLAPSPISSIIFSFLLYVAVFSLPISSKVSCRSSP